MSGAALKEPKRLTCKAINQELNLYINLMGNMEKALYDSGSTRNFIDITYVWKHNFPLLELPNPRIVEGLD